MEVEHAVSSVMHLVKLPLKANVLSMTVIATTMPCVGRGQLRIYLHGFPEHIKFSHRIKVSVEFSANDP